MAVGAGSESLPRQPPPTVSQPSLLMVPLSMAAVGVRSASLTTQTKLLIGLRGLSRQPRIQYGLGGLLTSRASCSLVHVNAYQSDQRFLSSRFVKCILPARLLSTARPQNTKNAYEKKATTSASTATDESRIPTSTSPKLTTTLKPKLNLNAVRHEQIYNIPNFLTLTRLIATPAIGYLIIHNHHLYAFSLFTYAAFSDVLDGWIARRWKLQTVVGSVVDPMADKLLMTTLVTCLAINGSLPMPLFALILGRDVSLAISALYYRYASLPAPKTMARYWDFSLPSAEVHPTTISKFNTFLQLTLLGTLLCTNLLHDPSATSSAAGGLLLSIQELLGGEDGVKTMIQGMSAIVASTTIYSGLEYTWSKKAVVILGGNEELKRKQGLRGRMIMASGFGSFIALAMYLWFNGKTEEDVKKLAQEK